MAFSSLRGNSMPRFLAPQKVFGAYRRARHDRVDPDVATVWYGEKEGRFQPSRARRRTPMADKGNDPIALWQKMIGEMEKGFNAFANQTMSSPEFSRAMNQAGGVSAGAQKQFGEFM